MIVMGSKAMFWKLASEQLVSTSLRPPPFKEEESPPEEKESGEKEPEEEESEKEPEEEESELEEELSELEVALVWPLHQQIANFPG